MSFGWGHGLPEYFPRVEDTKTAQPQPHMFCAPARAGNAPSNAARSREEDDTMSDEPELARTLSSSSFWKYWGQRGRTRLGRISAVDVRPNARSPRETKRKLETRVRITNVKLVSERDDGRNARMRLELQLVGREKGWNTGVCDKRQVSQRARSAADVLVRISRQREKEKVAKTRVRRVGLLRNPSRPMKRRHNYPPHNY